MSRSVIEFKAIAVVRNNDGGARAEVRVISAAIDDPTHENIMVHTELVKNGIDKSNIEKKGKETVLWLIVCPEPDVRIYVKPDTVPYWWDAPVDMLEECGFVELAAVAKAEGEDAKNEIIKDFPVVSIHAVYEKEEDGTAKHDKDGRLVAQRKDNKDGTTGI